MFKGLKRIFGMESGEQKTAPLHPSSEELGHFLNAAGNGDIEAVMAVLNKYGASVIDLKDGLGMTALIYAAASNRTDTVRLLLENGARINESDNDEYTPLIWAARSKDNENVVALLLENNADIDAADINNFTALQHAKLYQRQKNATLLEQWPEIKEQRKTQALVEKFAKEQAEITRTIMGGLKRPLPYKGPFGGGKP